SLGLPIDANGDRVGGPFDWLSWPAVLGGLAVVGLALAHSATFLALKADGPVRRRAARFAARWAPLCLLPLLVWTVAVQLEHGAGPVGWTLTLLVVVSGGVGLARARQGREGLAFTGYAGAGLSGLAAIFLAMFPVLLPSTVDGAFDITVQSAAHSTYTLGVMTVITVVALPVIVCYQAWSYWVCRHRVTPGMIPEPHIVLPAILRDRNAAPAPPRARLAALVADLAVVHGRVTLSSGREADYYVDLRRATLHHEASPLVGRLLRELTADWDFDAVGGLTLGADPVATAIMHAPGRPIDAFVVRKEAKKHGMQRRVEGPGVEGKRVLVVEDTTTTGNSPLTAVAALREAGAEVVGVATVVDRATGADEVIRAEGVDYRALLGLEDLGLS